MSLVFEALQSLEAERYGVFRPTPSEAVELLKCVGERRVATNRNALPMGPDVDVIADEPAKLFTVPSPAAASAVVASSAPAVAEPVVSAPASTDAVVPAPASFTHASPMMAASAVAMSAAAAVSKPVSAPLVASAAPVSAARVDAAPVRRAVSAPAVASPRPAPTRLGRAVSMLSSALPMVQGVLDLIDGNKRAAGSKLLAPQSQVPQPAALPLAKVDLTAITNGLTALKTQQHELRAQVVEQNTSLKRIEDHLEMVREATHRNTQEQKEMIEDLRGVGSKVNMMAVFGLGLLAASVAINLVLYLRILKVF